jgi:glyoxylase-like metal-dependent hydrolase (beta-lactamase superfamily II)
VYEVTALRYGTRETRKSECYLDWDRYGEPDAAIVMDYFFWVLRGEGRTIVVDTGFDPEVGARRGRTCLCPPVEALQRIGVEPGDVDTVILTHLHYDHTGNVDAFTNAEWVAQLLELEFWFGPEARLPQFAAHVEREEIERLDEVRIRVLDGDAEVARGVEAVLVGGHSPGQTVLVVEGECGPVVLASDAIHYYEELELERPFAIYHDLDAMRAGYATIRRLASSPAAALVPGHDPEVMSRFPVIEDGLGVRVA